MKKVLLWFGVAAMLSACGNGGFDDKQLDQMVGLYKATGDKMKAAKADYFVITAHKAVYVLQDRQGDYERDFKGYGAKMSGSYKDGKFESGDIQGTQMLGDEAELPENLKILAQVNSAAKALLARLNQDGLKLEVRLERDVPSFSALQVEAINELAKEENATALVKLLKDNSWSEFRINDYTAETKVYAINERLNFPSGFTGSAADAIEVLRTKQDEIERR